MFGNIVGVYTKNGIKLVSYEYNAWGLSFAYYHNNGANTSVVKNPYTYRGYYYDSDLGLYYLQSRYYDANTCRFINADGYVSTGQGILGHNMFAYCGNNPVMRIDPNGEGWILAIVLVGILVLSLTNCSKNEEAQKVTTEELYNNKTTITPSSEEIVAETQGGIQIKINIENYKGLSQDKIMLREYTDILANQIESDYAAYLNGNSVDRAQLYGEIMLHAVVWDSPMPLENTKVIDLNIYSDGSVKDSRAIINTLSSFYGWGY